MKRIYLLISFFALLFVACGEDEDPFHGQKPTPEEEGESEIRTVEITSAEYDNILDELHIKWDESIENDVNFLGTEFTYTTLSGKIITVQMLRSKHFLQAYNSSTVVTNYPKKINYRSIWLSEGDTLYSEFGETSELEYESVNFGDTRFLTMELPEFVDVNNEKETAASDLYYRAVTTDLEKHYTPMLRLICAAMWFNTKDPYIKVKDLHCTFEVITGGLSDAPAYVTSNGDITYYVLNKTYVDGLLQQSSSAASDEINGIGYHELTHVMQIPVKASGDNYYCFVEGGADASRLVCGGFSDAARLSRAKAAVSRPEDNPNSTGARHPWLDAYDSSGFFIIWLRRYDGDFWRKFNLSTKILADDWTFEGATKLILGADTDLRTLWREYKKDVESES